MKKLDIIYEDKEIIVVNKPSGKLTISDGKNDNTLYHEVRMYLNKRREKVFIVHRLDKETSGIVLFAKSEKLKYYLQNNWNELALKREYIAVVEGTLKIKKGTLKDYLQENKNLNVYVTDDKNKGKLAITNYEVIKETKKLSLLKINIETGRKNQIRCQLAHINHPIVGDKKYKSTLNPMGRLGLHASLLKVCIHNKEMTFSSPHPSKFDLF